MNQQTIAKDLKIKGVGLHTGCQVELTLRPAPVGTGIVFVRQDLPHKPVIKADPGALMNDPEIPRCTSIGKKGEAIHTVEHFLSALCGLGISNLHVEINERELPGLDGSAVEFVNLIKKAGVKEQDKPVEYITISEPIGVEENGSSIYVFPSDEYEISYLLDYDHSLLKAQFARFKVSQETYHQQIAPCRTFCLESEAKDLRENGLGLGANFNNTLVVGKNGVLDNTLRFPDEFARHKVLDFIGDLYLLGAPLRGKIFAVKSGHKLNLKLLRKIWGQKDRFKQDHERVNIDLSDKKEILVEGIMKILPHRYPFLLVDRVIEIENGKKGIGIKNVTANDNFFQGHFPTRPVMPGVLMVEAMAQTAGVVVLTNKEHHGKLAFFMSADNVKFRKVVTPGDQLVMEVEVIRDRARTSQVHAKASVNGEMVAEADMVFSFTDSSYLD